MFKGNWNPIDIFKNADTDTLLEGQYWNYKKNKSYQKGQITIGFLRLNDNNLWLLFHVGRVTKDLNKFDNVGYEYEVLSYYEKYFGAKIGVGLKIPRPHTLYPCNFPDRFMIAGTDKSPLKRPGPA